MTKVFINPNYGDSPDRADGGIRRVTEAMVKYLPKFGVEVVSKPEEADVINNHGASLTDVPGIPSVNSCHGLYWGRYPWHSWAHKTNRNVIESMARAVAHTAPSEWVAVAIRRGMLVDPEVVYHGIDAEEWEPGENGGYVLWNKAREDFVSDPRDMNRVAALTPDVNYISTLGMPSPNVRLTGAIPFPQMIDLIRNTGVYLATARETFGVGTLEAMVCGVPVVGWDWGGQSEIIINGETGLLVPHGDYEALAEAVRNAFTNRDVLGAAARQDVIDRWGWECRISQYAKIFRRVQEIYASPRPKVSVIITSYNLAHYLDDAVKSVVGQTLKDWECIVVDDCSTDSTPEVAKKWDNVDNRISYVRPEQNLGLSLARNFGMGHAKGQYFIHLDADDMLEQNALEILSDALDKDWGIHIAFGHLDTVNKDGEDRKRNSWPVKQFSWKGQMAHLNQLHYSSMYRREVFDRSGGYRKRHWRAEDAAFWCRVTSMGFRAKKVTQAATLIYRMRNDSKSMGESGDGDWTSWYPWRLGAKSGMEGSKIIRSGRQISPQDVPFGAQGKPPDDIAAWPVPDFALPLVSVIIPVGPGHEGYVIDAVESVFAQTFRNWELIVVNDTGTSWDTESPLSGAPYAKIVETSGKQGTPAARNLGASHARAPYLLWLDADDYLLPTCIEKMVLATKDVGDAVIYTDWLRNDGDHKKPMIYHESNDFKCGETLKKMQHAVTSLIPKTAHFSIGGFDLNMNGWEDWDYFISLQTHGLCSYRIPEPLFVYGFYTGERRERSFDKKDTLLQYVRNKWKAYYSGEKQMACRKCPSGRSSRRNPRTVQRTVPKPSKSINSDSAVVVLVFHAGDKINLRGPSTGQRYPFKKGQALPVDARDAAVFMQKESHGEKWFTIESDKKEKKDAVPDVEDFIGQAIVTE